MQSQVRSWNTSPLRPISIPLMPLSSSFFQQFFLWPKVKEQISLLMWKGCENNLRGRLTERNSLNKQHQSAPCQQAQTIFPAEQESWGAPWWKAGNYAAFECFQPEDIKKIHHCKSYLIPNWLSSAWLMASPPTFCLSKGWCKLQTNAWILLLTHTVPFIATLRLAGPKILFVRPGWFSRDSDSGMEWEHGDVL